MCVPSCAVDSFLLSVLGRGQASDADCRGRSQQQMEVRMDSKRLASEAETCRRLAKSYEGRPEQPFLLKAAALFEDLAEPRASELIELRPRTEAPCAAER